MTKQSIFYLAGIIDGEGTISITHLKSRNEYRLRLLVTNTDRRLMDWLKTNFGGLLYRRQDNSGHGWKDKYEWIFLTPRDTIPLLKILSKALVIKKEQCLIAIKFLETATIFGKRIGEKGRMARKELYEKMKQLNHRAVAETK